MSTSLVFLVISLGAAAFLVFLVIDYLKVSSGLKPRADMAKAEIRECEDRIESEQEVTRETKEDVVSLQKEIGDLEKELVELGKKVNEYKDREKRRKPTKFKLDE